MAEARWIKIVTDVFDDEKILLIESLPESDSMLVIWFKLLCLAGKNNNSGVFMRNINTVRMALQTFEKFGMIEMINDAVTIPNWSKHQNFDQIEKKNEYQKNYMQQYREKQKQIACNSNCKANSKTNNNTNGKTNSKANVSETEENRIYKEEENKDRAILIYFLKNVGKCTRTKKAKGALSRHKRKSFLSLAINLNERLNFILMR